MPVTPNTTGVPSRGTSKLLQNASDRKPKRGGRHKSRKHTRK